MLLFSCANKNFLFWRLSNDCQIECSALVSGPPNMKKPYNKHLISLVFTVRTALRTVNYGSSVFFPSIYGPCASRLGHKSMEKNSVRNVQYGPKTRLIRGIYTMLSNVTVRVCSKLKTSWKLVVFTNKLGKNSGYFMGVFNKTIIPLALVGYEMTIANSYLTRLVGYLPSHI